MSDKELPRTFVAIVTWNSAATIEATIQAVWAANARVALAVLDNASEDGTRALVEGAVARHSEAARTFFSPVNLGFCAGQNFLAAQFLESSCDYLLILNPDCVITPPMIPLLSQQLTGVVGMATPLLLRADEQMRPLEPLTIDAAGMEMRASIRHLDRDAGRLWTDQYQNPTPVFGGSGACLLLSRDAVKELGGVVDEESSRLWQIVPRPPQPFVKRYQLFDEAFFAYREDADLAWRAQLLGVETMFVPQAHAYHVRRVTPERRAHLPPILNRLGVRNRVLLQFNNLIGWPGICVFFNGLLLRNSLVLLAVVLREWSSLPALREVWQLSARARRRRVELRRRARVSIREVVQRWFS